MNSSVSRSIVPRLLLVAALAVSAPSVVQGQELSFSKELNSDQMACLRQLLKVSWTPQFHKEMMKIGQVATTVLNSKGLTNYVYIFDADGWCGTAGCPLLIGQVQRDGVCDLLYDGMGDESFTVLQRRDHGYRRIYAPCEARFDGRQYQQLHEDCPNPHVPR